MAVYGLRRGYLKKLSAPWLPFLKRNVGTGKKPRNNLPTPWINSLEGLLHPISVTLSVTFLCFHPSF
jgi:hypothetical protein